MLCIIRTINCHHRYHHRYHHYHHLCHHHQLGLRCDVILSISKTVKTTNSIKKTGAVSWCVYKGQFVHSFLEKIFCYWICTICKSVFLHSFLKKRLESSFTAFLRRYFAVKFGRVVCWYFCVFIVVMFSILRN